MLGVGDALRADPRVFVYGEDVGGSYGNAFLLLRPLLKEFGDRIINSPIAEGAVLGVCVGAALAGQRPIGEIQFNDFVATGFNQLVNNAAKIRYRWGGERADGRADAVGRAAPRRARTTRRTPKRGSTGHAGLKIVVPSTPHDARALMASAVADPDPVLYYEHIALYRDPRIKQALADAPPAPIPLGKAALRRAGDDLAIMSYGAYVHVGAARRRDGSRRTASRPACSICAASCRSIARRVLARRAPLPQGADHPRGLAHRRHRREPRRDHPGGSVRMRSTRPSASSARSTRRSRTRRRSRSSICRARRRSSARRGYCSSIDARNPTRVAVDRGGGAIREARCVRAGANASSESLARDESQGIHRTGTEVDRISADWLCDEVRRAGLTPEREPFAVSRVDPFAASIVVRDRRVAAVPLFDAAFTEAAGIRGRLGNIDSDAPVGLTEAAPNTAAAGNLRRRPPERPP